MSRKAWLGAAKLITGTFNAFTNGLTSAMPAAAATADRNVDMLIGGQAVLEGVMMRSLTGYSVAVRQPNGEVKIKKDKLVSITARYPFLKFPVLRGSVVLIQSLILGMRALNYSASVATENEAGEQEMSTWAMASTMIVALAMGIGVFILAPLGITNLIRHFFAPHMGNIAYNAIDGLLRAIFFFVYILSISFMDEIKRVFQYHGAEHKTVYTFEANEELTVENARTKSTLHPRCGTSFLMFVMAISILVFSLVPSTVPFAVKFLARVVLIPLIAGLAYEVIRFSARHLGNPVCRLLTRPGMLLQKITTKEPDDLQLAVAITALKEALMYDIVDETQAAVA
ncbi:MAG TPA: DUF1385 domain-containing protein [Thermoanaerobaculia bacterium]|jgi:uncharacterized protein YqhQ|nr:DUF1385 domain-containing protein [Thermoanaerobaculia bacterium]